LAAARRAAAKASRRVTRGVGTLETDLHAGVKSGTQGGASSVRANGDTPSEVCLSPVPPQLLISASTDGATLVALCAERTIHAGANDSLQSLKTSLLRFAVSSSTVKGARMLEAMAYVPEEAQK